MKFFFVALSACLLLGAPGHLIAQTVDCSKGFIIDETVDEILDETGNYCLISRVTVRGNLTLRNHLDVIVRNSRVEGNILITDSHDVGLFNNKIIDGNVSVLRARSSYIQENVIERTGKALFLAVKGTLDGGEGLVVDNLLGEGTINCVTDEGDLDDRVLAQDNVASNIQCIGQL
jgi:hypothetical protein